MARGRRLKSYLDYENALGDGIGVGYGQSYQPWLSDPTHVIWTQA